MKPTVEVTETNFETEVLKSNQPVLVGFATGWSLPSMTLDGLLEEIASEFVDSLKVARVKLDCSPNLGLWYGIRCLPTMLCFVDGEERIGIFGTTSKEAILSQLKPVISSRCVPEPGSGRFNQGRRAMLIETTFITGGLIAMAGVQPRIVSAEKDSAAYATSQQIEKGKAPGMQVQLLSENHGRKEYAVIFNKGDEAFSGLNEFAEKYHVTSAHFTAIGALRGATLAWFSPERKTYKKIPVEGQLEVASMIGDIALFNGKPVVHTHMVVGLADGTARAGHVLEAHVWPTLEVMVTVESNAMRKSLDPETGLALINPSLANKDEK